MTQRQHVTGERVVHETTGTASVSGGAGHRPRSRAARVAAGATAVLAAGALLVGCGGGDQDAEDGAPKKVSGEAAPAGGDSDKGKEGDGKGGDQGDSGKGDTDGASKGGSGGSDSGAKGSSGSSDSSGSSSSGTAGGDSSAGGTHSGSGSGSRCATGDLRASFGPNHPGAGQQNYSLVFTNKSDATCTVRGYPGLAFVNSAGEEISIDPNRTGGQVRTVTLAPGKSAWAPLSYSNPEMTGVPTVKPSAAKVTPPDEHASLTAPWSGGEVTKSGTASVPKIGPLAPGTGG
ncbi:DUF4232 domain-containing protein [Streptomyces sp. PU-14G]|uniref:DUF4232 domain-containing protein n=1 Tax=Streptomyces sp. PU-14G TaxID=2800808 RepID=UPI0034DFBA22